MVISRRAARTSAAAWVRTGASGRAAWAANWAQDRPLAPHVGAGQVQGLLEPGGVLEGVDGAGVGGCGQEHGGVAQQQLLGSGDQAQVTCGGVGHDRAVGVHVPRREGGRNP